MENDAVPKEVFVEADSDSLTINDYWDTSVDENRSSNEQPTETYGSLQVCPVSLVELDANSNFVKLWVKLYTQIIYSIIWDD